MHKKSIKTMLLASLTSIIGSYAVQTQAQTSLVEPSNKPIEITADGSLEWQRNQNKFVARQKAKATQGDVSLSAQTLTADYRDSAGSDLEIYRITAQSNVQVKSSNNTAYGDNAKYDVDEGLAVMTGQNLRMVGPDQTVTAQDRFEYWVVDGKINAIGRAKVTRPKLKGGQDTLEADKITATLKENTQGERVLDTMEAFDNVVITSPTEIVTGAYGIYRADTNVAELSGGVTIKRGPNVLQGQKATVDLNTNTSRMFGSPTSNGRVRGVFYPGSEKKPEN